MLITCIILMAMLSVFTTLGLWVLLVPLVYGFVFIAIFIESRKATEVEDVF